MIHWQPGVTLDEVERQVIMAAIRFFHGNKSATANSLGVSVRTIQNKLDRYEKEDIAAGKPPSIPTGH